jgi:RNA polymerase sigma-70 factor (ECF subfamily)
VTPTDEELMYRYAEAADDAAFRKLYERHTEPLRALIRRWLNDQEDVHDVLQQTFLHVHRARRRYRPGERLGPWLRTIARNLCRDYLRHHGRRREVARNMDGFVDTIPRPRQALDERRGEVLGALASISPESWSILHRHYFYGEQLSTIARSLGMSHASVRVRAFRARARLRSAVR